MSSTVAHKLSDSVGAEVLMSVDNVKKHFPLKRKLFSRQQLFVQAVDGVSFEVAKGEVLGVVGESGCGKSTLARLLMFMMVPDEGRVVFDGAEVGKDLAVRDLYRSMQMVFQDSYSSLNQRMSIIETIAFGPRANRVSARDADERSRTLLAKVGLSPKTFANRYPHELSGGQRQRVNIARALAMLPSMVILDESVSALDKSVEAQVLNLLVDLREDLNLTYIFISHDLNVVKYISDRVIVMYLGRIVESGRVEDIFESPKHPYTVALLRSAPSLDPLNRTLTAPLTGDPPNPINPPPGCRFRPRCSHAEDVCRFKDPLTLPTASTGHDVACHMYDPASGHSASGVVR